MAKYIEVRNEGDFVAIVEVYFAHERSVAADFVHFIVAVPVKSHRVMRCAASERSGDASEGELAAGGADQEVGGRGQVTVVGS